LRQCGYVPAEAMADADLVLLNTCAVRDHAEQRVFGRIGELKALKDDRPGLIMGVLGCMSQRIGQKILDRSRHVDLVAGPDSYQRIPEMLARIESGEGPQQALILDGTEDYGTVADTRGPGGLKAWLAVQRGCNFGCTYCIVPYVRGPEVSRPPDAIISQIKRLADDGTKQVTLLGQTVNSYEHKAAGKTWSLADILAKAAEIEGIEWIKFVTNYPTEKYFDEILQAMADSPKICPYLHIPAQSGSDRILQAMNRRYTADWYLALLDKARSIVPEIAIAGDLIVGFPGETDQDFQATVELVKKARYRNCFVFKYSPRPGTTADKRLQDTVPPEIKQARNIELLTVQEKISEELSRDFLGKTVKVLIEGPSKKPHLNAAENQNNPQLVARTATDHIVVFNAPATLAGRFAKVKITKTTPLTLFAELTASQE